MLASLSVDDSRQKRDWQFMNKQKTTLQPLSNLLSHDLRFVLTDIDGTLTEGHSLPSSSFRALWDLFERGFQIIPVTGRPAGWCEMIARTWPVSGVIGENGALYFSLKKGQMKRWFAQEESERSMNRARLEQLTPQILAKVPGSAVSSDQFCRLFDLAIDFCEDVPPLSASQVQKIKTEFERAGATAKVSNIHVNGWFGTFDKKTTAQKILSQEFGLSETAIQKQCCFVGDSPNDEPMFEWLKYSFGVANIRDYLDQIQSPPTYVSTQPSAEGFCEIADALLAV